MAIFWLYVLCGAIAIACLIGGLLVYENRKRKEDDVTRKDHLDWVIHELDEIDWEWPRVRIHG